MLDNIEINDDNMNNFNYSFYEIQGNDCNNDNDSLEEIDNKLTSEIGTFISDNTSCTSHNSDEIDEEKLLPANLFDLSRGQSQKFMEENNNNLNEDKNEETSSNFVNKLNINSKPFFPKKKATEMICPNKYMNLNLNNICFLPNNINGNINNKQWQNVNKKKINKNNKNKNNKKKKQFIEKEGDWCCYDCKNINFAFRNVCNRCKLDKEESEKKYIEAGKRILLLIN